MPSAHDSAASNSSELADDIDADTSAIHDPSARHDSWFWRSRGRRLSATFDLYNAALLCSADITSADDTAPAVYDSDDAPDVKHNHRGDSSSVNDYSFRPEQEAILMRYVLAAALAFSAFSCTSSEQKSGGTPAPSIQPTTSVPVPVVCPVATDTVCVLDANGNVIARNNTA